MAVSAGVAVGYTPERCTSITPFDVCPGTHDGWRGDLSVDLRFAQGRATSPAPSRPDVAR